MKKTQSAARRRHGLYPALFVVRARRRFSPFRTREAFGTNLRRSPVLPSRRSAGPTGLLVPLLLLVPAACALAQGDAPEIVAKHLEAMGGLPSHERLETRRITGLLTLAEFGMPWKVTVTKQAPDKEHSRTEIPGYGDVVKATDGATAWTREPGEPVVRLEGDELVQALREARFLGTVEMAAAGTFRLLGRAAVAGRDCHLVEGFHDDDHGRLLLRPYVDADDYLLRQAAFPVGDGTELVLVFSDYRLVDGIQVAFETALSLDDEEIMTLRIEEIEHGVAVDEALFAPPSGGR